MLPKIVTDPITGFSADALAGWMADSADTLAAQLADIKFTDKLAARVAGLPAEEKRL